MAVMGSYMTESKFNDADKNGDGKLTQAELVNYTVNKLSEGLAMLRGESKDDQHSATMVDSVTMANVSIEKVATVMENLQEKMNFGEGLDFKEMSLAGSISGKSVTNESFQAMDLDGDGKVFTPSPLVPSLQHDTHPQRLCPLARPGDRL